MSNPHRNIATVGKPLVAHAVWARLSDDRSAAEEALTRIRRAVSLRLAGVEADLLTTDMLVIHVLESAGLLRALSLWEDADSSRIDTWLVGVGEPAVRRLMDNRGPSQRWRGVAGQMAIHAWRGDQAAANSLMANLRGELSSLLAPAQSQELADLGPDNTSLYQIMCHVLLAADIARVAAGDITPPPPAWTAAVTAFLQRTERLGKSAKRQERSLVVALAGPLPWRSPAAVTLVNLPDDVDHSYAWYFPTLLLIDPRWE